MSKAVVEILQDVVRVACAAALLGVAPAHAGAAQPADEGRCPEVRRCLDLLEDGIDFIESGRWEAASVVLEEVVAGLEGRPPYARDLARAYVYVGVARLQIADADETRRLFAAARLRDPTLELSPAEFPRDVLEIWEEAREPGVLLAESDRADEPDGVSTTAGRSLVEAAAAAAPSDVLTTAQRFAADTTKEMGRSMWRTLIGAVAVAAGAAVIGVRGCTVVGAGEGPHRGQGTPVQMRDGTINVTGFRSWNRRGGCRMEYGWYYRSDALGYGISGTVKDHELLKSGDPSALSYTPGFSGISAPGFDASSFEERLPDALLQSVGAVHSSRIPVSHLIGGLALAGAGALLATIWSDGGVVVEEVAVSVMPTGGVLASRSFGW